MRFLPLSTLSCAALALILGFSGTAAAEIHETTDVTYRSAGGSPADRARARLDVYAPVGGRNLPCLVWFHGGNLVEGAKSDGDVVGVARALASDGMVVVVANYRLSPKNKFPAYLEDAAAAVAWTKKNAERFGGDPRRIFIGGHSAGGYLTVMLGADPQWLQGKGVKPADIAGLISLSGQMFTHGTVRAERGLPPTTVVIDEAAPVNHAKKDLPPLLLLYAGHDLPFRGAENRYFAEALEAAGNTNFTICCFDDRDHGTINARIAQPGDAVRTAIAEFVKNPAGARP